LNLRALLTESSNPLILGHQNADPDAICSMVAIRDLYLAIHPDGKATLVCDDVSRLANQVLKHFSIEVAFSDFSEDNHDLVILLDTNSEFQLGTRVRTLLTDPVRTVAIDHHEINPELSSVAEHQIVDSDASSDEGGCGCRAAGNRSSSNPLAVFGLLGILALRSFVRRARTARR